MKEIGIIGVGNIGSWLSLFLSSPCFNIKKIVLFDKDYIEKRNIVSSAYTKNQINTYKTTAIKNIIKQKYKRIPEIITYNINIVEEKELFKEIITQENIDLMIITVDNTLAEKIAIKTAEELNIDYLRIAFSRNRIQIYKNIEEYGNEEVSGYADEESSGYITASVLSAVLTLLAVEQQLYKKQKLLINIELKDFFKNFKIIEQ